MSQHHSHLERLPSEEDHGRDDWEIDMTEVFCINRVGSGAFGAVFRGTYRGQECAIKLLSVPADVSDEQLLSLRKDFRQEITVWSKLSHPNVVKFIGASLKSYNLTEPAPPGAPPPQRSAEAEPKWAILSEFMGGGNLRDWLLKRKWLPPKEAVAIALDIAKAFAYLHSLNVVHRDLKTENLLLTREGVVKVADFGVARREATNAADMTAETGTVRYMAPEVIDHRSYDRKADVYSFGIVAWEVYTCDIPFKNMPFAQLASSVVLQGLRPKLPDGCPPQLAALMQDSWHAEPEKRPEFADIVRRLEELQQNMPAENRSTLVMSHDGKCKCAVL